MSSAWSSAPTTASTVPGSIAPALDELDELVDDGARLRHLSTVALDRKLVAAEADGAAKPVAKRDEHAVGDARQLGGDRVRDGQRLPHRAQCRAERRRHRRARRARFRHEIGTIVGHRSR